MLTEELGHWFDDRLNSEDTPGDEGARFATLLLGEPDPSWGLASWQERGDDSTTLLINGEWVAVELAAVAGQTIDFRGSTEPQIINGSFGDDTIYGGDGGDTNFGDAGNDLIFGGAGNDTIDGGFGNDTIYGGDGDDRITSNNGSNNLYGEGGNDVLVARNLTGTHVLDGGSGDDLLIATGLNVTLVSTSGNDKLLATGWVETDGQRNHVLNGTALLDASANADQDDPNEYYSDNWDAYSQNQIWPHFYDKPSLEARYFGQATVLGGDRDDFIYISDIGSAFVAVGAGNDTIVARFSNWSTSSTLGDQYAPIYYQIDGGDGNDSIEVLGSSSTWSGQSSFLILGGAGDDTMTLRDTDAGRRESWSASSGISEATLDGGDGDDILIASGVLNLTLTGGSGRDTFVLNASQYRTLRQGDRTFYYGSEEYTEYNTYTYQELRYNEETQQDELVDVETTNSWQSWRDITEVVKAKPILITDFQAGTTVTSLTLATCSPMQPLVTTVPTPSPLVLSLSSKLEPTPTSCLMPMGRLVQISAPSQLRCCKGL